MASARRFTVGHGPHLSRAGAGKIYRGSRRRLRRIKWHEDTPTEFWIFVVLVIVMLIVLILWLTKHPPPESHQGWM
jgi:hypothetical protein